MLRAIFVNPFFNLLLLIYAVLPGHDFGLAVIILTIIIRIILWPLVKKQLHHQKAMRDLAPEIAKVKKKAGGDRAKESAMMLELFKSKEINPFSSIGLALLQFPILIALFFVLREIVDPARIGAIAYPFVSNLDFVKNIMANPEAFDPTLFGLVHMAEPNLIIALAAGVAQFFQARQLTPRNQTGADPTANLGRTMNMVFPVITAAIAAQLPSALALYWAASSGIAILQQQAVLSEDVAWMRRITTRARKKNGKSK